MNDSEKQELQSWAKGAFSLENVFAVGGRHDDGTGFVCFANQPLEACREEAIWNTLAAAIQETAPESWGTSSTWTFEYALLWLARRSDGAWLGIFTDRDLAEASRHALRARLDSFIG